MQVEFKFRRREQELSTSDIECVISEYADQIGIVAYELNFHDFKEVGINTLKKAQVFAKFARATIFVTSDFVARYSKLNKIKPTITIDSYGRWYASALVNGLELACAEASLETALSNLIIKIERQKNGS